MMSRDSSSDVNIDIDIVIMAHLQQNHPSSSGTAVTGGRKKNIKISRGKASKQVSALAQGDTFSVTQSDLNIINSHRMPIVARYSVNETIKHSFQRNSTTSQEDRQRTGANLIASESKNLNDTSSVK